MVDPEVKFRVAWSRQGILPLAKYPEKGGQGRVTGAEVHVSPTELAGPAQLGAGEAWKSQGGGASVMPLQLFAWATFNGNQEPSGKRACADVKGRIGALLRLGKVNDQQRGGDSEREEGLPGAGWKIRAWHLEPPRVLRLL